VAPRRGVRLRRRASEAPAAAGRGRAGRALGFLGHPTIGAVGWPDLRQPERLPGLALVQAEIGARVGGDWHEAHASLRLYPHPGEDIGLLGDLAPTGASAGWRAITVTGARDG
jgi:hypothetical protein